MRKLGILAGLLALVLVLPLGLGQSPAPDSPDPRAQRYRPRADTTSVTFEAYGARLRERTAGQFEVVNARLLLRPDDVSTARGAFEVFLHSIRSDRGAWDQMFRAAPFLSLDLYPRASFTLQGVQGGPLRDDRWVDLRARGRLDFHGVTRTLVVPLHVKRAPAGEVVVRGDFDIPWADHEVVIPAGRTEEVAGEGAHVHVQSTFEPVPTRPIEPG